MFRWLRKPEYNMNPLYGNPWRKAMGPPECCDMRFMLSFYILWLLNQRPMYGDEIAEAIGKKTGAKPTPGTIYPTLRRLEERGAIQSRKEGRRVVYTLTETGRKGILDATQYFYNTYGEIFVGYRERM